MVESVAEFGANSYFGILAMKSKKEKKWEMEKVAENDIEMDSKPFLKFPVDVAGISEENASNLNLLLGLKIGRFFKINIDEKKIEENKKNTKRLGI